MKILSGFLLLLLMGCTQNVTLTKIDPYPLFHDNSTKIWVVNKVMDGNVNYTPAQFENRDVMLFFQEGFGVYVQPMKSLGKAPKLIGTFDVKADTKHLKLNFKKEIWDFYMARTSKSKIVLRPTQKSDFPYSIELVPYPNKFF